MARVRGVLLLPLLLLGIAVALVVATHTPPSASLLQEISLLDESNESTRQGTDEQQQQQSTSASQQQQQQQQYGDGDGDATMLEHDMVPADIEQQQHLIDRLSPADYFLSQLPSSTIDTPVLTDCVWPALQRAGETDASVIDVMRVQGHRGKMPWLYFQNTVTQRAYVARVFSITQHHERINMLVRATPTLFQLQREVPSVQFALPMHAVKCNRLEDLPNSEKNVAFVFDFVAGVCLKDLILYCKEGKISYEQLTHEVANIAVTLGQLHRASVKPLVCVPAEPCILADSYWNQTRVSEILHEIQDSEKLAIDIPSVLSKLAELRQQARVQPYQALVQGKPDATNIVVVKVADPNAPEPKHVTFFAGNFHMARYLSQSGSPLGAPELDFQIFAIDLEDHLNMHLPYDVTSIMQAMREGYCTGFANERRCHFANANFVEYMELIARISLAEDEPSRAASFLPAFIARTSSKRPKRPTRDSHPLLSQQLQPELDLL